jgi:hypothetical protein
MKRKMGNTPMTPLK